MRSAISASKKGRGDHARGGRLSVDPLFFLPPLCFWLFDRSFLVPAALAAAFLHECGHLIMLKLLGGSVEKVILHPFGGEIRTSGKMLSYFQSLLLSFSGVAVNLALSPLYYLSSPFFHTLGACSFGLALFNLLPARGLDGGDILSNLLLLFCTPRTVATVLRVCGILCALLLTALFVFGLCFARFNPLLPMIALYLVFKAFCSA